MHWHDYLKRERSQKLEQIEFLSSGNVQLSITTNGVRTDVTEERLQEAKGHLVEIEQILRGEGVSFDA